jgi:2'-5' RNA ligase
LVRTVGVVVGIPEPWGSQLDQHRLASGDPMAPFIPAHLTLLGPVTVDPSPNATAEIEEHLSAVAATHVPFEVHLAGAGTFRPVTQVVFVAVTGGFAECEQLAADIRSGPLERELTYAYHPHVTVAHDVPAGALDQVYAALATFDARFPVDSFTLYEHGPDGHWHPRRSFPLAPIGGRPIGRATAGPAGQATTGPAAGTDVTASEL